MARKMMFEQLQIKKILAKKISDMELGEFIPFNSEIDSEDIPVVELESDHVDEGISADVKKILSVSRCKLLAEKQDFDSRVSKMTNDYLTNQEDLYLFLNCDLNHILVTYAS
jgi:hypothetical protein